VGQRGSILPPEGHSHGESLRQFGLHPVISASGCVAERVFKIGVELTVDFWMREQRNRNHNQQIREAGHVIADAYTWAEIFYLDSPTDYRECISVAHECASIPRIPSPNDEVIMLDDDFCWTSFIQCRSKMKHAFAQIFRIFQPTRPI